jgi:hypothetical protein
VHTYLTVASPPSIRSTATAEPEPIEAEGSLLETSQIDPRPLERRPLPFPFPPLVYFILALAALCVLSFLGRLDYFVEMCPLKRADLPYLLLKNLSTKERHKT